MSKHQSITAQCRCKTLAIEVSLDNHEPTRVVCYCDDCSRYAHHLQQAEFYLDAQGGTDIVQLSPAQCRVKRGSEHLALLRLTEAGLYRWYASCCQSPLLNTPASKDMPYVGLLTKNIKLQSGSRARSKTRPAVDDATLQDPFAALIGPVKFGVGAGHRHPIKAPWPVARRFGFRCLTRTLRNMARWRLRGDHKHSPFIDFTSGEPVVKPVVIGADQPLDNS